MSANGSEPENLLAYFRMFFREAPIIWRAVIVAYFVIFLFTPLYGLPAEKGSEPSSSSFVAVLFIAVLIFSVTAILLFNRRLSDGRMRRPGQAALLMVATPLIVILLSAILGLALGTIPAWALRALTSIAMIVPLSLVIVVQVESVVRRRAERSSRLPFLLAMVTIFLIIYTFGTFYYINGLIVKSAGGPLSFSDALYQSGLAFTTLGFSDALPIGVGKALIVFEAISGFLVLSLLTAIFLEYVTRPKE
jgi:hypothetical protein